MGWRLYKQALKRGYVLVSEEEYKRLKALRTLKRFVFLLVFTVLVILLLFKFGFITVEVRYI